MGRKRHPEPLTPAEQRVLEEIRTGATNAEIAVRLGLSINTVKYHVANMLAKTGLSDRSELRDWKMPREGGRFGSRPMRAAVGLGVVGVVVAAVLGLGVLFGGEGDTGPDSGVWLAYSPGPRTSTLPERVVVVELATGYRRVLEPAESDYIYAPQWSPKGEHLLLLEPGSSERPNDVVILERSSWRREEAPTNSDSAAWSPDGTRVLAVSGDANVSILDADANVVASVNSPTRVVSGVSPRSWAPDGSWAALVLADHLAIVRADGNLWAIDDFPTFGDLAQPVMPAVIGWSRDSSFLLVAARASDDTFRVDPTARTVTRIGPIELGALLDTDQVDILRAAGNDACIVEYQPAAEAVLPGIELQWRGRTVGNSNCVFVGEFDPATRTTPLAVAGPSLPAPVVAQVSELDPETMSIVVVPEGR